MSRQFAHDLEGGIDLGFIVVDLAGLADAQLIALRADANPLFNPKLLLDLGRGNAFDAVYHARPGELGMHGRGDPRTRDLLQSVAQAVSEKAHSLARFFRPDPEVEIEGAVEAGQ